jgi:Family of unknown function (DUF6325)
MMADRRSLEVEVGMVDIGPVDVLLVRFPGNQFRGEIAPALRDLVERDIVRVIDLLFVYRDADGTIGSLELAELGPDLEPAFVDIDGAVPGGILEPEDVDEVAAGLEPNSSVAVLVIENRWAIPFVTAMRGAGAEMIDQARIPADVANEVLERAAGPV